MNKYEYILMHRKMLEEMLEKKVTTCDMKHIQMYEEYIGMRKQGEKYAYVLCVLSQKYNLSERAIKKIVQRLTANV